MTNGTLGTFLQRVAAAGSGDPRAADWLAGEQSAIRAAATGQNSKIPHDGGFLVAGEHANELFDRVFATGALLSRCRRVSMTRPKRAMAVVDERSRANGSRFGGLALNWLDEGELIRTSRAQFRVNNLQANRLAGVCFVTDELLEDADVLEDAFRQMFTLEAAHVLEDLALNGSGAGRPLGVLESPALVTVPKTSGQAAATITAANVADMAARLWPGSWSSAVWAVSQTALPQLLVLAGASVNQLTFVDGGMQLLGRPVIVMEQCPPLGTVGDIILFDPAQYVIGERSRALDLSLDIGFMEDQGAFRFTLRVDGQPLWHTATLPQNGGASVSPFIALAERA